MEKKKEKKIGCIVSRRSEDMCTENGRVESSYQYAYA